MILARPIYDALDEFTRQHHVRIKKQNDAFRSIEYDANRALERPDLAPEVLHRIIATCRRART